MNEDPERSLMMLEKSKTSTNEMSTKMLHVRQELICFCKDLKNAFHKNI